MAGLLVSVRSASEAVTAVAAGADVIDVKEPLRGPLGAADPSVWRAVRAAVPGRIPVSIALGELVDRPAIHDAADLIGITYRKIGLADARASWRDDLKALRDDLDASWIAVIYADWQRAKAPEPDAVLDFALENACAGVLVDTWDKSRSDPLNLSEWTGRVSRARNAGLLVALAGRLDVPAIGRLRPLQPDLFAVRGAACASGDRLGLIDPRRVAALIRAIRAGTPESVDVPAHSPASMTIMDAVE
jgi:uncharacterized protein (UPF0264 family)